MEILEYSDDIKRTDEQLAQSLKDDCDKGAALLKDIGAAVAIFGSSRLTSSSVHYEKAVHMAKILADEGFHITSGGSYGIMEAANRGAFQSKKGESLGFNLVLPFEQDTNPFTTRAVTLENFAVRKGMLVKNAVACVAFAGGFGTLDEIFDTSVNILCRKMLPLRIYLYGSDFWTPLVDFMKTKLVEQGTIEPEDLDIWRVSDDVEWIKEDIKEYTKIYLGLMRKFGLEGSKRYALIQKQLENFKKER
ncbi:MAG: TIGR00730 family Rossman fold protein [Campylobacteraceae bacterium]|jgi:uncharacterized protein (TIGR00730 family)|nr:TIGR00730 family Rossman fold protein [Campylobacteraceae bacterium]